MRIGIDGRYIQDHFPGIGRYTYSLIAGLAGVVEMDSLVVIHNPRLANRRYDLAALGRLAHVQMVETDVAPFSLAEQWALPRLARRIGLDVWHAPYYIGPYRLPCPLVVTVHDAISSRYPQYLPSLAARLSYEATMRLALRAARRVIAVSQASQADLAHYFGVPPAKMAVVYEAADGRYAPQPAEAVAEVRSRLGLPQRYVLYLGMNKPHKNLVRLVEAWARWANDKSTGATGDSSVQLVIAGREDERYPQARQAAERLGANVRFLGDVAEADMPALYSGATLFAFPSLYEGFGLPLLEAMACGVPAICSTAPSLLEIAGDAAVTFDPLDVEGMAQAIGRVLSEPGLRESLSRRSLARAAQFSWRRAAAETLAVYRTALIS